MSNREDETTIIVPASDALEFKFQLEQFGSLTYEWSTDNATSFDFVIFPAMIPVRYRPS